jgi:hypothetical protein
LLIFIQARRIPREKNGRARDSACVSGDYSTKEFVDRCGNFIHVRLQREVACVEQHHGGVGIIAAIGLGTWWGEERIVFAPDREQRRLALAEVALELRIQRADFDMWTPVGDAR